MRKWGQENGVRVQILTELPFRPPRPKPEFKQQRHDGKNILIISVSYGCPRMKQRWGGRGGRCLHTDNGGKSPACRTSPLHDNSTPLKQPVLIPIFLAKQPVYFMINP
jgi:hypothetical protein